MYYARTVLIISILFKYALTTTDIKIVFWLESSQVSMSKHILRGLQDIGDLGSEIRINPITFFVDREVNNEDQNMYKFCQLINTEGVSAVFDFTYYPWDMGLEYVHNSNIPYLLFARTLLPFFDMFSDFMKEKNGDDVAFIMQGAEDLDSALHHLIMGFPFKAFLVHANETDFVEKLHQLRPSPTYYAIFAYTEIMNEIFEKVQSGNLLARPAEWHLIFLDGQHEFFKYKNDVENITKFTLNGSEICSNLKMDNKYCQKDFVIERAILLRVFKILIDFHQSHGNLLKPKFLQCNSNEKKKDLTQEVDFDFNSLIMTDQFLKISNNKTSYNFGYSESNLAISYDVNISINIYKPNDANGFSLAKWKSGDFIKINETISAAKRFFRIGVVQAIPWNYYKRNEKTGEIEYDSNGKPIWDGFCNELIKTLSEKLNFVYELVEPETGRFGAKNPLTNQWDGVVGDLVSGKTEIAVTALKMYSEREEVIDYIAPYFEQTGISIVIRKPVRETSLFKFMTVLRFEVWLSVLASLVATAVMLWFLDKYSPYSARNNKEAYPYPCRQFTLRESFWFALTSFTPQGGGEAPKSVSGRILVAAYWLFVVLMLATFTANLAAFLTVERMQTPVQSLEQLGRQSRINYSVVADSDTHQYFINMKHAEDTLYRLWKELVLNSSRDSHKYRVWDYPIKEQYGTILLAINGSGPVKTAAEGFQQVSEHEDADFAFIHDSSEIKYEITINCNLTEVGEVFAEQPYALAIQQGSHLSDELSYVLLELQKDRYFEELKGKFWNTTRLRECSSDDGSEGISLESLGGVFIATFVGLMLAMITLVVEVSYYKRKEKKQIHTIVEVKTVKRDKPELKKEAWHTGREKVTPPPPFVTLGGEHFKPKRLAVKSNLGYSNEGLKSRQKQLPPYME